MRKFFSYLAATGFVLVLVSLMAESAFANGGKIWVCHVDAPPSNNRQAIHISQSAWENSGEGSHSPGAHGGDFGPISGPNDPDCKSEEPTATSPPPTEVSPTVAPTDVPPTESPTEVAPTATSPGDTPEPTEAPTEGVTPTAKPTQDSSPTEVSPSATPTSQKSEPQPSSTPHPVEEPPTGGSFNLSLPDMGGLLGSVLLLIGGLGLVFVRED